MFFRQLVDNALHLKNGSMREEFIYIAYGLDKSGLVWQPELGDEIAIRNSIDRVSILVDPEGMTPKELRNTYVWLPTVEQLVRQLEARQAFLYHAGLADSFNYETVVKVEDRVIETEGPSLRISFGQALREVIAGDDDSSLH